MKKTFKYMTTCMTLVLIIFSAGSFQLSFMHCVKSNITNVSGLEYFPKQEKNDCEESENGDACCNPTKCSDERMSINVNNTFIDHGNNVDYNAVCCLAYRIFYQNDFTSEAPVKISAPVFELPEIIHHDNFAIVYKQDISIINQSEFADISPHPIIEQILKSIRQKSIQSPDESVC